MDLTTPLMIFHEAVKKMGLLMMNILFKVSGKHNESIADCSFVIDIALEFNWLMDKFARSITQTHSNLLKLGSFFLCECNRALKSCIMTFQWYLTMLLTVVRHSMASVFNIPIFE